ncbi:RTC4 [Candida pseudojiufengensis]|uniref:RTC4 n=1 Tax=Candida pseudojiufengensis TaxID=497109 RepID=UPI002224971C|nr:RTC4 [Candida pseudojiufengensis]KAI5964202.1 RTC4 [Candida pseudojiufengensis]
MNNKSLTSLGCYQAKSTSKNSTASRIEKPTVETGIIPYKNQTPDDNVVLNNDNTSSPIEQNKSKQYSRPAKNKKFKVHNGDGTYSERVSPSKKNRLQQSSSPIKDSNPLDRNIRSYPLSLTGNDSIEEDSKLKEREEFGTVLINELASSPKRSPEKSKSEIAIDIDLTDDEDDIFATRNGSKRGPISTSKLPSKKKNTHVQHKDKSEPIKPINLLLDFQVKKYGTKDEILNRHKRLKIPVPITSRSTLLKRASKYYKFIPEILSGKADPSIYYERAKDQCVKSRQETMSAQEKLKVNWESFYGGYYGFQRQSVIGSDIFKKFETDLNNTSSYNKTVKYWTPSSFAMHVLANEIILRMIIEDLKCRFEKAEEICQSTVDYGIIIADHVEIVNDMKMDGDQDEIDHDTITIEDGDDDRVEIVNDNTTSDSGSDIF